MSNSAAAESKNGPERLVEVTADAYSARKLGIAQHLEMLLRVLVALPSLSSYLPYIHTELSDTVLFVYPRFATTIGDYLFLFHSATCSLVMYTLPAVS